MSKAIPLAAGFFLLTTAGVAYALGGTVVGSVMDSSAHYDQIADNRDTVHDQLDGTVLRSTSGACVRTNWDSATDECDTQATAALPTERQTILHYAREERTVYAAFNQTGLTPQMQQRLDSLATLIKSDQNVAGVRIVGYADRMGNPGYNEKLSQKRAENVRAYLVAKGLTKARVADTRWVGANAPVTDCPNTLKRAELIDCLQQDRRVEIEVDYTPDRQAAR